MRQREYVETLAAELGYEIEWTDPGEAAAGQYPALRRIVVPKLDGSQRNLAVVLHELGHAYFDHEPPSFLELMFAVPQRVIQNEAEAWAWAIERLGGEEALTPATRAGIAWAFGTYLEGAAPDVDVTATPALTFVNRLVTEGRS